MNLNFLEIISLAIEIRRDADMILYGFYLELFSVTTQPIICFLSILWRNKDYKTLTLFTWSFFTNSQKSPHKASFLGKVNRLYNVFQMNYLFKGFHSSSPLSLPPGSNSLCPIKVNTQPGYQK